MRRRSPVKRPRAMPLGRRLDALATLTGASNAACDVIFGVRGAAGPGLVAGPHLTRRNRGRVAARNVPVIEVALLRCLCHGNELVLAGYLVLVTERKLARTAATIAVPVPASVTAAVALADAIALADALLLPIITLSLLALRALLGRDGLIAAERYAGQRRRSRADEPAEQLTTRCPNAESFHHLVERVPLHQLTPRCFLRGVRSCGHSHATPRTARPTSSALKRSSGASRMTGLRERWNAGVYNVA